MELQYRRLHRFIIDWRDVKPYQQQTLIKLKMLIKKAP